jgi:hypothetical protein
MLNNRFWAKVKKLPDGGCWLWTANKNNSGYGMFRPGGLEQKKLAHRLSYAEENGPIPKGEGYHGTCVLHKCDTPSCVNPDHLFLGTHKDNMADKVAKGLHRWGVGKGPLPDEKVRELRKEMAGGKAVRQLARETGVNRRTLGNIRDGNAYSRVT